VGDGRNALEIEESRACPQQFHAPRQFVLVRLRSICSLSDTLTMGDRRASTYTGGMAARTTRTPEKEATFLAELAKGRPVEIAARLAGMGRRTVYDWREADPEFAALWDEAYETGTALAEDELRRRGVEGWEKPIYQRGEHVGNVREFSDLALLAYLRARKPAMYRERYEAPRQFNTNVNVLPPVTPELATGLLQMAAELGMLPRLPAGDPAAPQPVEGQAHVIDGNGYRPSGDGDGGGIQRTV
jgi:hypothetical protein